MADFFWDPWFVISNSAIFVLTQALSSLNPFSSKVHMFPDDIFGFFRPIFSYLGLNMCSLDQFGGNFGHPKSKPRVNYELFPEPKPAFKAPLRGSE